MDISNLMHFVKTDSIKNLVWAKEIQTTADKKAYEEKGYNVGFTYGELTKEFSEKVAENFCYNNGFTHTFYYDKEKHILFTVNLIGKQTFGSYKELDAQVLDTAAKMEGEVSSGNYFPSLMLLNDKMRMEMLNILVEENKLDNPYQMFLDFYQTSDYGCNELSLDTIQKLCESKTESHKSKTLNLLSEFPDRITVYRGVGDKSSKLNETISWTTDINVANFFASRLIGAKAAIYIAEVNKGDIIEYFNDEKECIVLPKNIDLKDTIPIYGTEYFKEHLHDVLDRYLYYKQYLTDLLAFKMDDAEHGRLHSARVLLNALLIANELGISETDMDKLCMACVMHDVGREDNYENTTHGEKSAAIYKELSQYNPNIFPYDESVAKFVKYHCLSDKIGISNMYFNELQLFSILKDADALERVRFGIRDLDINQLRTKPAKSMTMIANMMLSELKISEPELEQDINMT